MKATGFEYGYTNYGIGRMGQSRMKYRVASKQI